MGNQSERRQHMARDLRIIITRSRATIVTDALGMLGVALLLIGALHMPALF